MGLKSGLGSASPIRESHHHIHKVGLPLQLNPEKKKIQERELFEYNQGRSRPFSRKDSVRSEIMEIPEKENSILERVKSEVQHKITSDLKLDT